jgi:hypothetical protein
LDHSAGLGMDPPADDRQPVAGPSASKVKDWRRCVVVGSSVRRTANTGASDQSPGRGQSEARGRGGGRACALSVIVRRGGASKAPAQRTSLSAPPPARRPVRWSGMTRFSGVRNKTVCGHGAIVSIRDSTKKVHFGDNRRLMLIVYCTDTNITRVFARSIISVAFGCDLDLYIVVFSNGTAFSTRFGRWHTRIVLFKQF